MNSATPEKIEANQCPLCGRANDCQRCATGAYKGSCRCFKVEIPEALIARVQVELRDKACICRECVMAFHRAKADAAVVMPGDFYFENGLIVFTAAYHKRRGYCCGSECRHCPFIQTEEKCRVSKTQ